MNIGSPETSGRYSPQNHPLRGGFFVLMKQQKNLKPNKMNIGSPIPGILKGLCKPLLNLMD